MSNNTSHPRIALACFNLNPHLVWLLPTGCQVRYYEDAPSPLPHQSLRGPLKEYAFQQPPFRLRPFFQHLSRLAPSLYGGIDHDVTKQIAFLLNRHLTPKRKGELHGLLKSFTPYSPEHVTAM